MLLRLAFLVSLALIAGCATPILHSTKPGTTAVSTKGAYYFLPKALLHVRILETTDNDKNSQYSLDYFDAAQTQVIERQIVPDPDQLYILDYQASASSDDVVKITIDPFGLLKKIESTTEDKAGPIILKLLDIAKEGAKLAPPPAGTATKVGDYVFAPEDVAVINQRIKNDMGEGAPQIKITAVSTIVDTVKSQQEPDLGCHGDGICFRPLKPYIVEVTIGGRPFRSGTVLMPNGAPILSLPVHRAAFVKNITNVSFDQGILSEVAITKPSELVGFMEIPLSILKAILAIPGEYLQFKVDYSSSKVGWATAQTKELEAAAKLLDAQRKLLDAQKSQGGGGGGF